MGKNYDLLLQVLKKWPIDKSKGTRCFAFHLRELARKGFPSGNIFHGGENENYKKLSSLLRLADNKWGSQYAYRKKVGASGYKLEDIHTILSDDYVNRNLKRSDPSS